MLHAKEHVLDWQTAWALATFVVHFVPHEPQSLVLLVVSTHVPEQSVSPAGQPLTQAPAEQVGVPESAAQTCPHEPQLFLSVCSLTHAPLHREYPLLHVKPQVPAEQVGEALATFGQACPQLPQFCVSVDTVTHVPPQDACPPGQPETHTGDPPPSAPPSAAAAEHTGAPASALQATPQKPQLAEVLSSTQELPQRVYPSLHEMVHALFTHTGCAFGSVVVHTWLPPSAPAQPPQLVAVLVVSTHAPLQSVSDPHPEVHEYVPPSPAAHTLPPVQAWLPASLLQPPQLAAVV